MKKNKLDLTYEFDFDLVGIVSNMKEYKLAWHINSVLAISLAKQDDIRIEFSNQSPMVISNFKHETEFVDISMLQNRLVAGGGAKSQLLIPELKQFDYLLKLKDATGELSVENVCTTLKEIEQVEYAAQLNFGELKSKENLLY